MRFAISMGGEGKGECQGRLCFVHFSKFVYAYANDSLQDLNSIIGVGIWT